MSLGDVVCTSAQCTAGETSVRAMDAYYQSLDPGTRAQYTAQHDAIMTQFNAADSWYSSYIPFNPTCCTVLQIGQAADQLLCQMQGGSGCTYTSSSGGGMSLAAMIVIGAVAFLTIQSFINRR